MRKPALYGRYRWAAGFGASACDSTTLIVCMDE
jgi:hypothetical protein